MIRLKLVFTASLFLLTSFCFVLAQDPVAEPLQFRRGFVKENDLPALGLEGFVPVDIVELESLLSNAARTATESQANGILSRSILSATLVGEDLVSDLSRFEVTGRSGSTRIRLEPMTLAFRAVSRSSSSAETTVPEADCRFMPDGSAYLVANQSAYFWFSWSSHGTIRQNSRIIEFDFQIPSSIDGTLLLRLPPSWRVESSVHVVRQVESFDAFAPSDWPKVSMPTNPSEGLWVVTLGGSTQCKFELRREQQSVNVRFPVLVNSQKSTYQLRPEGIVIRSKFDLHPSTDRNNPLHVVLSPGTRIRSMTWKGKNLAWSANSEASVQFQIPQETPITNSTEDAPASSESIIEMECVSPWSIGANANDLVGDNATERRTLPSAKLEGSYVLAGTSEVRVDDKLKLSDIRTTNGVVRVLEENASRWWQASWNGNPPSMDVAVQSIRKVPLVDSLTVLTLEAARNVGTTILRVDRTSDLPATLRLRLPARWVIDSISSLDSETSLTSQFIGDEENPQAILEWSASSVDLPLQIEVRLHQNRQENETDIQIDGWDAITIDGAEQRDVLVVETSDQYKLQAAPALLRSKISEKQLKGWQAAKLPKSSSLWILTLEDHTIPDIRFILQPNNFAAVTNTNLRSVGKELECFYRVRCVPEAGKIAQVAIEFDGPSSANLQWSQIVAGSTVPVQSFYDTDDGTRGISVWTLQLSEPTSQPFELWGTQVSDATKRQQIALPNLPQATSQVGSVSIDESLTATYPAQQVRPLLRADGCWDKIQRGIHFEFDPARNNPLEVQQAVGLSVKGWVASQEVEYVVMPTGAMTARSRWQVDHVEGEEFLFAAPAGWEIAGARVNHLPVAVVQSTRDADWQSLAIPQSAVDQGPWMIEAQFECTPLERIPDSIELLIPTVPYQVGVVDRALSLPKGLSYHSRVRTSMERLAQFGQFWKWHEALAKPQGESTIDSSSTDFMDSPEFWNRYALSSTVGQDMATLGSVDKSERFPVERVQIANDNLSYVRRWLVFLAFMGLVLFLRKHRLAFICAAPIAGATLAMIAHDAWLPWIEVSCLGITLGSFISLAHWIYATRRDKDSPSTLKSTKPLEIRPGSSIVTRIVVLMSVSLASHTTLAQPPVMSSMNPSSDQVATASAPSTQKAIPPIFDVIIPMNDQGELSGSVAYIPDAVLDRLLGKSSTQQKESEFEIVSARYQAVFSASTFDLTPLTLNMSYEVDILGERAAVVLPFVADQAKLLRFLVDDREVLPGSKLIVADGKLRWLADRAGRVKLRMEIVPKIRQQESNIPFIQVDVLPVASAQLEAQTDRIGWLKVAARGQVLNPQIGRYIAQLGPVKQIEMSWQPKDRASADRRQSEALVDLWLNTDREQPVALTVIDLANVRSDRSGIEIECSSEWQPIGLNWGQAKVVETVTGTTLTRRRYRLNWDEGQSETSSASRVITVAWIPENPSAPTLGIPSLEIIGTRTKARQFACTKLDGTFWEIQGAGSWQPPEKTISPNQFLFDESVSDYQIRSIPENSVMPILRRVSSNGEKQVRMQTEFSFQPHFIELSVSGVLKGTTANDHALRFQMPRGSQAIQVQINDQSAPFAITRTSDEQDQLVIFKQSNVVIPDNFRMKIRWPIVLRQRSRIPTIEPTDMALIESRLIASRAVELSMEFEGVETMLQSDGAFLSKLNVPLWDFVQPLSSPPTDGTGISPVGQSAFVATYLAEPIENTLSGIITTRLSRPDSAWLVEFDANLTSELPVESLLLEIPAGLLSTIESDCPRFVFAIPGENRVILNLRPTRQDAQKLSFRLTAQLPSVAGEVVSMPVIRLLQKSRTQTRFAVPANLGNQQANWKTAGVRVLDQNELDDVGLAGTEELVFIATSANPQIRLASLEATQQNERRAVAEQSISLAQDGLLIRSQYWILAPDAQSIKLRIPSSLRLLSIAVNGHVVSQEALKPDGTLDVPVFMGDLPFALELTSLQRSDLNSANTLSIQLPIIDNIEMERTYWSIQQTVSKLDWSETSQMPDSLTRGQWDDAMTADLLSVLERGVRLLVSRSPADRQAWFAVWNPIVSKQIEQARHSNKSQGPVVDQWSELANRLGVDVPSALAPEDASSISEDTKIRPRQFVSFGTTSGQQASLRLEPTRQSESQVWLAVTGCLVTLGSSVFAIARFKPSIREFILGHPWWLLFAIAIGFAVLLPWRWIGGLVALLSVISAIQAFIAQRQRMRRSRNLSQDANWQKSPA